MGQRPAKNIVLTGFSYTGKTRVGQEVASRLGWEFVDIDAEIVRISGKSVSLIFGEDGEERFRDFEREMLEQACSKSEVVVSTGGGAVMRADNREIMMRQGVVVCLEAQPATIYERLLADSQASPETEVRPLLTGNDPLARIEWLKESRQRYYALADWTVHTDNLTAEEAAEEVIRGWRYGLRGRKAMPSLPDARETDAPYCEELGASFVVNTPSGKYPVFCGFENLAGLGGRIRNAGLSGTAFIISDSNVWPLYGERVEEAVESAGLKAEHFVVPEGEASKSFQQAIRIYDWLVEKRGERKDTVVALGGGVIGDLAGFVAATFLRGVPLIQVPTSLVGMVDSSVGGKVAINHPSGKNLIGAFYQPRLVVADLDCLKTLPEREFVSGWSEVIKHAAICDETLFKMLEERYGNILELEDISSQVITRSGAIKARIVSADEKEEGLRTILNYGHTIAHGLEAATGYERFLHGEAVSIGMVGAARISLEMGLLPGTLVERQTSLLARFGLPTSCRGVEADSVIKAIELDKKVRSRKIRWVLLTAIGHPIIRDDIPAETAGMAIRSLTDSQ